MIPISSGVLAVAVIIQARAAGRLRLGSGTIISRTSSSIRILTADHVVQFGDLTLRLDDGSIAPARVVVQVPNHDLAIVEAPVTFQQSISVAAAQIAAPESNEDVDIVGEREAWPIVEAASIADVGADLPDGPANGRFALECDACHPGDSGGGIFDARGALVGVYVGYFEMNDDSRVSVAENFLDVFRIETVYE